MLRNGVKWPADGWGLVYETNGTLDYLRCAWWYIKSNSQHQHTPMSHPHHAHAPGPSNSHSSPATLLCPSSVSKSSMALRRSAVLACTTLRGWTVCLRTSPGYRGKGSWESRISWSANRSFTLPESSDTGLSSMSLMTGFSTMQ